MQFFFCSRTVSIGWMMRVVKWDHSLLNLFRLTPPILTLQSDNLNLLMNLRYIYQSIIYTQGKHNVYEYNMVVYVI